MINWFSHLYPYTNVHELNLDWILDKVKSEEEELKNFVGSSIIKYAVPIQWDITRQYERNTVVIDAATGDAYISIDPVPAGFDLSHTEYWMKVFTLGNQLAVLESQIASNEGNSTRATKNYAVGDLLFVNDLLYVVTSAINNGELFDVGNNIEQTTIDAVLHYITTSLTNVSDAVVAEVAQRTSDVNGINARLNLLENRRFIIVSDSYGDYPTAAQGWMALLRSYCGLTEGTDCFSISVPGAGFGGGTQGTFLDAIESIEASVTSPTTITDIVVCGGINDRMYQAGISAGMTSFISYCNTHYANATVHVGFISKTKTSDYMFGVYSGVLDYYKEAVKYPKAKYIKDSEFILNSYEYMDSNDPAGTHPSVAGSMIIAQGIANYIKNGNVDVRFGFGTNIFAHSSNITSGDLAFRESFNNGMYHLNGDATNFVLPGLSGSNVLLGEIQNVKLVYGQSRYITFPVECDITYGNNQFVHDTLMFTISSGKLYANLRYTGVTAFTSYPIDVSIPYYVN